MRIIPPRFLARISLRLMLFNILVVFLPVAGVLFLGSYEKTLEQMQVEAMERQAWLVMSAVQDGRDVTPMLQRLRPSDGRIRIVIPDGHVIADLDGPRFQAFTQDGDAKLAGSPMYNPFGRLKLVSMRDIAEKN